MAHDYVSIVEAAYVDVGSELDWVQSIAVAARPCLDDGHGLNVYTYDASDPSDFRIGACASAGDTPMNRESILALVRASSAQIVKRAYLPGAPEYASRLLADLEHQGTPTRALKRNMAKEGAPDVLAIRGGDLSMRGCVITSIRSQWTRLSPAQERLWACIGAHLASGFRLRQRRVSLSSAPALFDTAGRLVHVSDSNVHGQDQHLRRAIGDRLAAVGPLRKTGDGAAIALWRAMVQGEWTLVDHVDSDGKRFVLARENRPGVGDPGALTLRERQVATYASFGYSQKHIAYELGLSTSSVSENLKCALRKLRLKNRAELVALMRA